MSALRSLGLLLAAGLLVRLALWAWFSGIPIHIVDEQHYNALAIGLVERREFAFEPGQLTSIRPPLYPAFVAGIYSIFGAEAFQEVRLVQALLSLVTVLVVFQIGRTAFSERVGLVAAGLVCFYPSLLGANNLLLTETLFTLLLCISCLLIIQGVQRNRLGSLAAAGVAIGLAALTRSILWLFPPVLALLLIAGWRVSWPRRMLAAGLMTFLFAATIAPWAVRNTQLQRTFTAIDCMGGRNFMMGNYEHTPMFRAWDAIALDGDKAWHHVLLKEYPQQQPLTQGQLDKLALKAGIAYVADHPGLSVQRSIAKFFCFWQLERELLAGVSRGYFGPLGSTGLLLLTGVIFVSYALALWSGLFGMFLAPPENRLVHGYLILTMAFICGIHTLVFGHSRYHLPLMPVVLLYSASALVHAGEIARRRGSLPFVLASLCCLVFGGAWAYEVLVIDLERFLEAVKYA